MSAPKAPTVVVQPTVDATETQEAIEEQQLASRKAAQKAMGRNKTMLSNTDVNPVTGESTGASFLGG